MNIYISDKYKKETKKVINYSSVSKSRYNNNEYSKLYADYDADLHCHYLSNHEYYDFEIVDGVVIEIEKEVVIDLEELRSNKKAGVRKIRYTEMESKYMKSDIFDNLCAERNMNLMITVIRNFEKGRYVKWKNIFKSNVVITSVNFQEFCDLEELMSAVVQESFDRSGDTEDYIDTLTVEQLQALDVKEYYDSLDKI